MWRKLFCENRKSQSEAKLSMHCAYTYELFIQLIRIIKGLYLRNEFPDTYAHHVSSLIKLRQSIYIKLILHTRTAPVRGTDP